MNTPSTVEFSRVPPRDVVEIVLYEMKMWLLAVLKAIPGRIGCALRRMILPGNYGEGSLIWDGVHIDSPALLRIGARTSVNRGSILNCGGGISIGDDVLIGPGVVVYSQNHRYEVRDKTIRMQGFDLSTVTIGNDVWVAARAVILPGVTIGIGAVVAAGAVVTKDVEPFTVVAGVPARVIGKRSG